MAQIRGEKGGKGWGLGFVRCRNEDSRWSCSGGLRRRQSRCTLEERGTVSELLAVAPRPRQGKPMP